MEITTTDEWTTPLPDAARQLHDLLTDVDAASDPPWQGTAQKLAAQRYEKVFLPMLAAHLSASGHVTLSNEARVRIEKLILAAGERLKKLRERSNCDPVYRRKKHVILGNQFHAPFRALGATTLDPNYAPEKNFPIPPLDVALFWAVHRLSPRTYDKDCMALFGTRLHGPACVGLLYVCARTASTLPHAVARLQWDCFASAARSAQPKISLRMPMAFRTFLPRYLWPRHRNSDGQVVDCAKAAGARHSKSALSFDLQAAALRQKEFFYSVATPYYVSDEALVRGAARYARFLMLMRHKPSEFLVPLYDIDLIWHAHILSDVTKYTRDCEEVVGRFVEHEEDGDRSSGGRQHNGYARTVKLWELEYGETYADEHTQYRGQAPASKRVCNSAYIINENPVARANFINSAVCLECSGMKLTTLEHAKREIKLRKKIRYARVGQAQGGACGALYASGVVDIATMATSRKHGGACGGLSKVDFRDHSTSFPGAMLQGVSVNGAPLFTAPLQIDLPVM